MKTFLSFLKEGFIFKDNELRYDAKSPDSVIISDKLKKQRTLFKFRETTFKDSIKVFSVYSELKNELETINRGDILNALKGKSRFILSNEEILSFIKRAVILSAYNLQDMNIDVLISMHSSSDFIDIFMKEISDRMLGVTSYPRGLFKDNDLDKIYVDSQNYLSDEAHEELVKKVEKIKSSGTFSISKIMPVQYRKFIHGFIDIDSKIKSKLQGKKVCIVDDFLTSGTTMNEAAYLIKQYGPKEIIGLTVIKK